jgi:uncharacterized protein YdeI (YjbR/CyaY-like superfamily)
MPRSTRPRAARFEAQGDIVAGAVPPELPVMSVPDRGAWAAWLEEHHADAPGVWLELGKKGSGVASPTQAEAVEVALCFGWIDSQAVPVDERRWRQRFTPRGPRSRWSKINRGRAERLIAAGAMRPAGLREVERAKDDGRWEAAYDGQRTMAVPDDLRAALDASPAASAAFDELDSANRYSILYRVNDAKRPETRARRIERFVAMLERGERLHP